MKLLWVTNVFPTPLQPNRGVFNRELTRALAGAHECRVVCPVAFTDEWGRSRNGRHMPAERATRDFGTPAVYPRYFFTPKVMRRFYGTFMWRSVRGTVCRELADFSPDVVIGYWAHPDGEVAVRAARLANVQSVVMVGGSDIMLMTASRGRRRRMLGVLNSADAVVAVSQSLKKKITDLGLDGSKVHVVERGVDTSVFFPGDRDAARSRVGLKITGPVVTWVGRMVPVKGLDVLIDASSILKRQGAQFHVCLVGDGPLRDALAERARQAGLDEVFRFVGPVAHAQLPDWYRASDLVVLPSRSEGIPNVLREASACGIPYVASRVGGIPELADSARNRLVPPEDPVALAQALSEALTDLRTVPDKSHPIATPANTWDDSARALSRIVLDLRQRADDRRRADRARLAQLNAPAREASPLSPRQLLRSAMRKALPARWFLVRGPSSSGSVGLSFDDGPHPEHTPRVLDALRENGVKATFFVVGRRAAESPDLVRRICAEGHAIGHHSFEHASPALTPASRLVDEIVRTQDVLKQSAGVESRLFRPPYGTVTAGKLLKLWKAGQTVVLWSADPRDYECESQQQLLDRTRSMSLRGGDIVLLHDSEPHTASALGPLIRSIRDRGLGFCTIDSWAV